MADAEMVIDARQFDGMERHLADPEFMRGPARDFIQRGGQTILREVNLRTPVDTGHLRRSIATESSGDGLTVRVGTNINYAPHVEYGTLPHDIRPRFKKALHWGGKPGIFAKVVHHPGTKARRMFGDGMAVSIPQIEADAQRMFSEIDAEFRT